MTSGEKALYHSIIEQLKDKELSDSQKDNFVKKLDELFKSMNDQSKEFAEFNLQMQQNSD